MDKIIAFIEKAIKNNLNIRTTNRNWGEISEACIYIYKSDDSEISIQYISEKSNHNLSITKGYLDWVTIEVSEMDIARFKVEIHKAQEYTKKKVIEYFNSFFKEEDDKQIGVDDLDDDDLDDDK